MTDLRCPENCGDWQRRDGERGSNNRGDDDRRHVSRRAFLKASTAGIASVSAWQAIPRIAAARETAAAPRFTFMQLNDTHVQGTLAEKDDTPALQTYVRANDKLAWWVDAVNREPRPSFVLGIGDLIHGGRLDRLPLDLEVFQKLMRPLRVPFYPNVGNHEVVQEEGNPLYERAYRKAFGDQRVNYTFESGGLLFIMLNNSGAAVASPDVIHARNGWLHKVLKDNPTKRKILGCHIPIIPLRQEPVLAKSFGFISYQAHDPELLGLVDEHADSIVAVLSGHLHLTGYVERRGVHHISVAGTASYPSDYARYTVYDDRIEMQVCQLPRELAMAHPSIHGKANHPMDFTDRDHKTADEYQIGRSDERRLTIALR